MKKTAITTKTAKGTVKPKTTKAAYKIRNWSQYNESLVNRGNLTFWLSEEVIENWRHKNVSPTQGRPFTYSDTAIEILLTIRELYQITYRATEGFGKWIFALMKAESQEIVAEVLTENSVHDTEPVPAMLNQGNSQTWSSGLEAKCGLSSSEFGGDGNVSDENYFRGQIEKSTFEKPTNRILYPLQNPKPLHQTRYAKIRLNPLRNNAAAQCFIR